jgi:outer membrane protein OmpA-like peptidoglycan-associated protein
MARYMTYDTTTTSPLTRKWLVRALIISLLLHVAFFVFALRKKIEHFAFSSPQKLSPPAFVIKQVFIDPKTLEKNDEERIKLRSSGPKPEDISVPLEKPEPKEIVLKPSVNEVQSPLLQEKPESKPINLDSLMKTEANSAGAADKELGAIASALLKDSVRAPKQPLIKLPMRKGKDGADAYEGIPGRQSIDDALSRSGPLPAGGVPIAMPGGALFDYDRSELRGDALDDLHKLGELIQRNPAATFRIEGHTDAIGSREYNLALSLARAEEVKAWLVQNLHINPARIETIGFGPDKLLVPGDKSIDEQQPNRRVEIVIKTNRK